MELNSGWYLYSFFGNTGMQFGINEDGVTNYCNWNTGEGEITGLDVAETLVDLISHPGFLSSGDGTFITNAQEGTVIAAISGVWNAMSVRKIWAHKLADWITNEENQNIRFVERNQGPSNIKAAASDEVMKVPAIQAVIDQSQFGVLQRVGNHYWSACTDFVDVLLAGNTDGNSLQELLDNLVAGITASTVK